MLGYGAGAGDIWSRRPRARPQLPKLPAHRCPLRRQIRTVLSKEEFLGGKANRDHFFFFFFLKAGAEEYRIHTELPGSCHAVDTVSKMVALILVMDSDDDVTVVVSATRTRAKQNERREHSRTSWACGLLKVYALILEIAMH